MGIFQNNLMGAAASAIGPTTTEFAIWNWGLNNKGQLGVGDTTTRSSPVQMGDKSDWVFWDSGIQAGAVNAAGELWMWGQGTAGALGQGNTTDYSSPVQVGSLTDWVAVSTGYINQTHATKTDGTLWAWGSNDSGQLGLGDTTDRSSPVQVGSLTDWGDTIATINFQSSQSVTGAVKPDGTLWMWGDNGDGQLGLGDTTSRCSPTQVGSDTDWTMVSIAGHDTSSGIKNTDELYTWGKGNYGQIGNGTDGEYSSPVQVAGAWSKVAGGGRSFIALRTNGALFAWGRNYQSWDPGGILGIGTSGSGTNECSPVQIGSLTDWADCVIGQGPGGAINTSSELFTWGANGDGALGNGTTTGSSSPAQVGSTEWGTFGRGTTRIHMSAYKL